MVVFGSGAAPERLAPPSLGELEPAESPCPAREQGLTTIIQLDTEDTNRSHIPF